MPCLFHFSVKAINVRDTTISYAQKYLHWMTNETDSGCVSRTCCVITSAIQQSIKHPSLLTSLITGSTAEERMGAVVDEENRHYVCETNWAIEFNTQRPQPSFYFTSQIVDVKLKAKRVKSMGSYGNGKSTHSHLKGKLTGNHEIIHSRWFILWWV